MIYCTCDNLIIAGEINDFANCTFYECPVCSKLYKVEAVDEEMMNEALEQ